MRNVLFNFLFIPVILWLLSGCSTKTVEKLEDEAKEFSIDEVKKLEDEAKEVSVEGEEKTKEIISAAKNLSKEEVDRPITYTTDSGIIISDQVIGEGQYPNKGDRVIVHYTGKFLDGEEFDSSHKRGQPFEFILSSGSVIKGWDEGVASMKVGGKRTLTIPPDLAYGSRDRGKIPANSTLVFDIELIDIVKPFIDPDFSIQADTLKSSSGLMVINHKPGIGSVPNKGDRVVVHYTGKLTNGEKFDSSYDRDLPFEFAIGMGQVIQGWEEGISTMKPGGKRTLIIPPELGYGDRAAGKIPPGSTLIFNVELIKIKEPIIDPDFSLPGKEERFESGLTIITHVQGDGVNPEPGQKVKVHYRLLLPTGDVVDSSYDRGQPFSFTVGVGQVIKGWDEALQQMSRGQKCSLIIPPEIGYGASGAGGVIPPSATLVFEVELLDIAK